MGSLASVSPAPLPPAPAPTPRGAPAPERGLVKLIFCMSPGDGDWCGPFIPVWQTSSPPSLRTNTGCGVGGTAAVYYPASDEQECKLILVKTTRHLSEMAARPSVTVILHKLELTSDSEEELALRVKNQKDKQFVPLFGSVMRKPDSGLFEQFSRWDTGNNASPINFSELVHMPAGDIRDLYQDEPIIYLDTEKLPLDKCRYLIRRLSSILEVPCYIRFGQKEILEEEPNNKDLPLS